MVRHLAPEPFAPHLHRPVHREQAQRSADIIRRKGARHREPVQQVGATLFEDVREAVLQIPARHEIHQVVATKVVEVADVLTGDHVEIAHQQEGAARRGRGRTQVRDMDTDGAALGVAQCLFRGVPPGLQMHRDHDGAELAGPDIDLESLAPVGIVAARSVDETRVRDRDPGLVQEPDVQVAVLGQDRRGIVEAVAPQVFRQ